MSVPMQAPHWTIFNSGGAVVRDDCTLEAVRDYMTPERFKRGWNAVYCINVTSQEQLDAIKSENAEPADPYPLIDPHIPEMGSRYP